MYARRESTMGPERIDQSPLQPPLSRLELILIDEFVRTQGYDPDRLSDLPEQERKNLLRDASVYASMKLTEVESRAHFVEEIHSSTAHGPFFGTSTQNQPRRSPVR
jgi:hypothetical protein